MADNPPRTGRLSARHPRSRTSAESFALSGPSELPDPRTHAYRQDLADVALARQVLASHYAKPVERALAERTALRTAASDGSEALGELAPGEPFALLDDSLGWAWGYAGEARRVGYVRSDSLSRPRS